MSEPESDDDVASPSPRSLRATGIAITVAAIGGRLLAPDDSALVSWGMGMLGLALALFGGSSAAIATDLAVPADPDEKTTEPTREVLQPIRILGFGSAAIGLIGVLWVLRDVDATVQATDAWWVVVASTVGLIATAVWSAAVDRRVLSLRVEPPETAKRRHVIMLAVAAALLAEIAIPASYYFGDDRFDERFAWRMFSDVRVYQCQLDAFDVQDGRATPVQLSSTVHVAWINTMRRSREGVLQRYLTWRCERAARSEGAGIDGARIVNQCRTPEGEPVPLVVREIECASGHITAVEAP